MITDTYRVLGMNTVGSILYNESCYETQTDAKHDEAMSTPGVVAAVTLGPFRHRDEATK